MTSMAKRGEREGERRKTETGCKEGSSHAGGRKEKHRGAGRLEREDREGKGREIWENREESVRWDRGEDGDPKGACCPFSV